MTAHLCAGYVCMSLPDMNTLSCLLMDIRGVGREPGEGGVVYECILRIKIN